jgi:hypothetical protein
MGPWDRRRLPPRAGCIKNHYMPHYTAPRVVSVRLPGDVFEALKADAKDQGRSVSGSITYLVKEQVTGRIKPRGASKKLTGFLSHVEVPASLGAWRAARKEASKKLSGRAAPRRNRPPR